MRRDISMEEVARHRTQDDAWLVYNGKVRLPQHLILALVVAGAMPGLLLRAIAIAT